ncbi:hypothetical protein AXE65_01880 [Ventosimonas gracilis]|uniref:Uncharacterized protein n=1 Tax=Ventosimonas gracilis TaxID=1680762 RepID=A0A139SUV0_9GAMM|nr:hypothetical protein [Ventosimonas gracilis]KXU38339.1 hypothetical protein AXE65_01880 [Ventosimonas gracilis]
MTIQKRDGTIETKIAVACRNASGMPDMPVFTVTATRKECELGVHYDKAEAQAEAAGYEAPFVCFDASEQSCIVFAVRELGLIA